MGPAYSHRTPLFGEEPYISLLRIGNHKDAAQAESSEDLGPDAHDKGAGVQDSNWLSRWKASGYSQVYHKSDKTTEKGQRVGKAMGSVYVGLISFSLAYTA